MKYINFLTLFIMFVFCSACSKLPNFIVVGVPGSGKGTFSQYLIEHYGYQQVSIGDLIRSHVKNETELGKQICEIVKNGQYIDDAITVQLIAQKIEEFNILRVPFIIDGFPRNQYCLNYIKNLLQTLNLSNSMCCVQLDAKDNVCEQRIASRLVCLHCARVNSCKQFKDIEVARCFCGANLVKRDFDDAATTIKRINFYRTNIESIILDLKKLYLFYFFNTECSIEECYNNYETLMNILNKN